jgi:hypothetical protein
MTQINYNLSTKNVYNNIKATVTPWTLQASTTLWTLGEVPVIAPNVSLPIWGNSTVSGESVFVDAWNTPVASTDYKTNTASTGLGTSLTHLMSVSVDKFAQAIKYDIFNTASVNAYLTLLQGRGTWYDSQNQFTLKSEDINSESYYQKRTFSLDGKYITDSIHAQEFCDSTLAKYKNPHAEVSITIMNKNDTLMEQILCREISDRITVVNTKLGLSQDYSIDWMEHEISNSGLTHVVTYKLVNYYNKILVPNNTLKITTYAPDVIGISLKSPGTMADDASVGITAWSNPNNAKVSDNIYAIAIAVSHYLKATNFGFSIPTGATVNGILVEIERKVIVESGWGIKDVNVKIVKADGSIGSTNKADTVNNWPTSDTYKSYGGTTDLWGETLIPADINNSNFGVVLNITANSGDDTANVDHIRITVYYSI